VSIAVDDALLTFMLEPAECGALDRRRRRVQRIHFHDPTEAVGLIRFGVDIETLVELPPGILSSRYPVAGVVGPLGMFPDAFLSAPDLPPSVSTGVCSRWFSRSPKK